MVAGSALSLETGVAAVAVCEWPSASAGADRLESRDGGFTSCIYVEAPHVDATDEVSRDLGMGQAW